MSPAAAAAVRAAEESWFNRSWGGNVLPLVDTTHQRRYYHAPQLLDLIDVGLVWRPGHQQGQDLRQQPSAYATALVVVAWPTHDWVPNERNIDAARRASILSTY